MKKAIIILYFIVIGLGGWLAYACYCNLSFDPESSAGLFVSVLGILVTLLVTWQIFTLIDIRQYKKDFEQLRLDIEMEKRIQRRAIREFAAETKLSDAVNVIRTFDAEKRNYEVIGIGYCSLIHALKNLVYSNTEKIKEVIEWMQICIYLAKLHNAWDKVFPQEIENLSKNEYHFITSPLLGIANYISKIDEIKKWRQSKTMDKETYKNIQKNLTALWKRTD